MKQNEYNAKIYRHITHFGVIKEEENWEKEEKGMYIWKR